MSLSIIASGTAIGSAGGVTLATTSTPGIYILELDCSNLTVAGTSVQVTFSTSVKPIFSGSAGVVTSTDVSNRNGASPQTSHLFTHARQVGTIENGAAKWVLTQSGNAVTFDWTLFRRD